MKKIAVLIPAYNAEQTVALAIDSMLWQEIPDGYECEIHVRDDGSSDGTQQMVEQLAQRTRGCSLRVDRNERNLGVAITRSRLIAGTDADFFVVMDADDISLPGRVAAQVEALEAGHDLVGTFAYNFGTMHGERRYSVEQIHHLLLAMIDQRSFCHPTIAFNRKVAQIGYRQPVAEDYGLLTDVLVDGLKVTNVPRHYLMYRVHGESLSSDADGVRFARLRQSVTAIRASYIARLLGIDTPEASAYSAGIERRIFRRDVPADSPMLDQLGALVRKQLGAGIDFRRI